MSGEWEHQCRRPLVWLARMLGARVGRRWTCDCGRVWRLGVARISLVLPNAPEIIEWQEITP